MRLKKNILYLVNVIMYWNEFYMYKRIKSIKGNNEEIKCREESLMIIRLKGRKICGFFIREIYFF